MTHLLSSRSVLGLSVGLAFVLSTVASAVTAAPNSAVYEQAQQAKEAALSLLERLVNIDSGTGYEPGLNQVEGILIEELQQLGAEIETVPATPNAGLNVIARFTGSGKGKILLIAHTDTVFKAGTAGERPFRIREGRGYGPGVCDDKGGVVAGLYALKILQHLHFNNYARITLLLNPNEETGSVGSRQLIEQLAKAHDVALTLEPGREADGLVAWRKGSALVEVEVTGRAAHAGVRPESGRNAALELAYQVLQLSQLGDAEKQTTLNFTVLTAGDRVNVIPDHASARADLRVWTADEFDRVARDLTAVSKRHLIPDTDVSVTLRRGFPPFTKNPQTEALVAKAQAIYAELGRTLTVEGSGGAADSSLTAGAGAASLDALGLVGGNPHTAEEYVELDSVVPRLYLLSRMLMELGVGQ